MRKENVGVVSKKNKVQDETSWFGGIFLSRITRRSSTKYAILSACLASLSLPI